MDLAHRMATCEPHGLAYDPSTGDGCVVCRRSRALPTASPRPALRRVAIAVVLVALAMLGVRHATRATSPPSVLPTMTTSELTGRVASARSRDRVVIVHVWTTWCPSCRKELPEIDRAMASFSDAEVELLMIAIDDDARAVDAFLAEHPHRFRVVTMPRAGDLHATIAQLGGRFTGSIPYTLVLPPRGDAVAQWSGWRDASAWHETTSKALALR